MESLSAIGALIGLVLAIVLIIRKVSPVYSLMIGAIVGGLCGGMGLGGTVSGMVGGVKDISPAVLRILSAGVLSGVLIKTGAAASISRAIIDKLGRRQVYLALALSAFLLCAAGVFVDVAVLTVAPIALMIGESLGVPKAKLLLAMIGGAKSGNIISPNPNTIVAAENFGEQLSSVMYSNIGAAIVGLLVTVYVIVPLMPSFKKAAGSSTAGAAASGSAVSSGSASGSAASSQTSGSDGTPGLPSFWASIAGPVVTILLLSLRPLTGISIDPLIALPAGGLVCLITTRKWKMASESIGFGLEKMSVVAVLLIGTGTIAGIIKASSLTDILISTLGRGNVGEVLLAPLSGMLMAAATASTTAGATIASSSFADAILSTGIPAVWGAAMVNASCTILDQLPHGSFFHATGGSVEMTIKERLRLIPYETAVGLVLTIVSVVSCLIFR